MPADSIAITGLQNGQERFKVIVGSGWIMDVGADGSVLRQARMSESDRIWFEKFIRPKAASQTTNLSTHYVT